MKRMLGAETLIPGAELHRQGDLEAAHNEAVTATIANVFVFVVPLYIWAAYTTGEHDWIQKYI